MPSTAGGLTRAPMTIATKFDLNRIDVVRTAAQRTERRKMSSINDMHMMKTKRNVMPESQGGPRMLYKGKLIEQFMNTRNRQHFTRNFETSRVTTSEFNRSQGMG